MTVFLILVFTIQVDSPKDVSIKDAQTPKEENPSKNILENDLKSRLITSEVRISELVSQVVELQQKVKSYKTIMFYNIFIRNFKIIKNI